MNNEQLHKISRRGFMIGAIGLGATVILGGCGESQPTEKANTEDNQLESSRDTDSFYLDTEAHVKALGLEHLQEGLPWDPTLFIGQTKEQITDSAPILLSPGAHNDDIAEACILRANELVNFGWSEANILEAVRLGYFDENEDYITQAKKGKGVYSNYINDFMRARLDGFIQYDHVRDDGTTASDKMVNWLLQFPSYYIKGIEERFWSGKESAPLITIDQVENGQFSVPGFSKSIVIDYSMTCPTRASDGDDKFQGQMYIGANEGAGGIYDIALREFSGTKVEGIRT